MLYFAITSKGYNRWRSHNSCLCLVWRWTKWVLLSLPGIISVPLPRANPLFLCNHCWLVLHSIKLFLNILEYFEKQLKYQSWNWIADLIVIVHNPLFCSLPLSVSPYFKIVGVGQPSDCSYSHRGHSHHFSSISWLTEHPLVGRLAEFTFNRCQGFSFFNPITSKCWPFFRLSYQKNNCRRIGPAITFNATMVAVINSNLE